MWFAFVRMIVFCHTKLHAIVYFYHKIISVAITSIDIIGTGNLAFNLAPALEQAGFVVNRIYGRNAQAARELAGRLYQAAIQPSLDFSDSPSNLFILAIADDAIEEVSRELILPDKAVVAHTSGSKSLSVLGYTASPNIGVLYPLQTFSKVKKTGFKDVPILIEGDNKYTRKILTTVAARLSRQVLTADSRQRRLIHLAAVMAANFTNALLHQANQVLQQAGSDLDILAPLMAETLQKSFTLGPQQAQTGPAVRGDLQVLETHLEMLAGKPQLQETYRLLSQYILDEFYEEAGD